jgi:predicted lipid-binding transport protein (Tim44 family)
MIIEAFAEGDKETLKSVLAEPVYDAFARVIDERDERGETVETEVKAIEKVDILESVIKDDMLFITLKFTARETCIIRDKEGRNEGCLGLWS